ncbi:MULTISPECIES: hypothetical protein [Pseudomonas]|uniref:hypothetical protein n=1 Tax=Pseudomonas beijingensis TaxID=2954101 RepID=UPI0027323B76|nr:hypothetical protein [Pseudomonas sp. FP830]WLI47927.1 hypothetical protein PSH84_14275 [Pseudomonas sp. FP830]
MSGKGFLVSFLDRISPPSEELLAVAERINRLEGEVRVSTKGAVTISTSKILHDADFLNACEEAKIAISKSS